MSATDSVVSTDATGATTVGVRRGAAVEFDLVGVAAIDSVAEALRLSGLTVVRGFDGPGLTVRS